jgi:putative endonuclease
MYYTYVLLSKKDGKFYSGYSKDLRNRLKEHNEGRVFSTKSRRPLNLIYYEACVEEEDAKQRERYLKSGRGKAFLKSRLRRFLQCSGFGPVSGTP